MRRTTILAALVLIAGPARAQEVASQDAPLSAIDWLSQSVALPAPDPEPAAPDEPAVADDATAPDITVSALDTPSADRVGVLPPAISGLPATLWSATPEDEVLAALAALPGSGLPASIDLQTRLMLAEAAPPQGAGADGALYMARVDRLLQLGALDAARALLEAGDPAADPRRFRRWFDVALLLGEEDAACRIMLDRPALAPTLPARVFCLARGGDWTAAALTLNTAIALGDVTEAEEALLTRFLDDGSAETAFPLPLPERTTPLDYRLYEAIGEALPTADLPLAFARADLRPIVAWRLRIEAAERLARAGAIGESVLFDLYTESRPAASGGVWDRATAIAALETALADADAAGLGDALPRAWAAMQEARLEVPFARAYARDLAGHGLAGEAGAIAHRLGLLTSSYESTAIAHEPTDPEDRFLHAIARGAAPEDTPPGPRAEAVRRAFAGEGNAMPDLDPARLGPSILAALDLLETGRRTDPALVAQALAGLRTLGLEDDARRLALQYVLLERPS
ncbi:hypothetical protein [Wenxinia saemankumensis]|uniref:Uncharacterized protein n=1 Tax=Wenxinia saemankumensis TaxID=1447782 RepID=A0A1M6A083_9RHOB|nr:hypothetical protein [Wenxinia saemankumensis]SHI29786.1 hypothetical protein SAMN05444417_0115 [Wenxinia saemankumensis]